MKLFGRMRRTDPARPAPTLPPGIRAYAIGDVHGRLDLLTRLVALVEADDREREPAETHLVMLGDYVDRGPDSAGVVEMLRTFPSRFARLHAIMGNHEEMLLSLIDQPDPVPLAHFLRFGGYATFESYGAPERMLEAPELYPPDALPALVPPDHVAFLRALQPSVRLGDYLFVHAGIRPDVPIEDQVSADLRWIRAPFLTSEADHGVMVVHGHTISAAPELRPNRIGIDTGAFASGVLTALGLERTERWLFSTGDE